jgi:hypothetical protein
VVINADAEVGMKTIRFLRYYDAVSNEPVVVASATLEAE